VSSYQRLALARLHLGGLALVKNDASQELDVVVALAQTPPGHLPHHGKGIGQDVVQGFAVGQAPAKLVGFGP